jgi:hypothetical protein
MLCFIINSYSSTLQEVVTDGVKKSKGVLAVLREVQYTAPMITQAPNNGAADRHTCRQMGNQAGPYYIRAK